MQAHVGADVLVEQDLIAHRFGDVGDRRQRLVVHEHQLSGIDSLGPGLAQDHGHDVADEPDLAEATSGLNIRAS